MALQDWFAQALLFDVFERWLQAALLCGAVKLPNGSALPAAKLDTFCQYHWQGRRWQWVDPFKDISAAERAVALGVKSRRQIADEMGVDFDDVLAQLEQEQQLLNAKGLFKQPEKTKNTKETDDDDTKDP